MPSKNILFLVISMNKGGAERVVSILLKRFNEMKNINVYLIMMESGMAYDIPNEITPIVLSSGSKNGFKKFIELPLLAWKIKNFAKKNNIDTIVSFLYRPNYINIFAKIFGFKGKSIINIRSTTSRYLNEGLQGKINLFLIRQLFNKADLIISNSNGVKEDLEELVNITTKHISIPNPIDLNAVNKQTSEEVDLKIDDRFDYVISVGRLIPLKRHADLILAFEKIKQKIPNAKLLFLGDGILKEELVNLVESLGLIDKVIFLGNVDNPFYYLKKSKIFVMTSEIEGFPNVLIEAMACGLPVISSNCKSGPLEILKDNKYGLLFEVGDIEALSKKILLLFNDKKLYSELSIRSKGRAKNYDVDKIINTFEEEILS